MVHGRKAERWRNWRKRTTRSLVCGRIWLTTGKLTRFRHSKNCTDWLLFRDSVAGAAWPFSVGRVICLVDSFNKRDLSLLKSVKYDSSLFSSQRDIVFLKYVFVHLSRTFNLCSYIFKLPRIIYPMQPQFSMTVTVFNFCELFNLCGYSFFQNLFCIRKGTQDTVQKGGEPSYSTGRYGAQIPRTEKVKTGTSIRGEVADRLKELL